MRMRARIAKADRAGVSSIWGKKERDELGGWRQFIEAIKVEGVWFESDMDGGMVSKSMSVDGSCRGLMVSVGRFGEVGKPSVCSFEDALPNENGSASCKEDAESSCRKAILSGKSIKKERITV